MRRACPMARMAAIGVRVLQRIGGRSGGSPPRNVVRGGESRACTRPAARIQRLRGRRSRSRSRCLVGSREHQHHEHLPENQAPHDQKAAKRFKLRRILSVVVNTVAQASEASCWQTQKSANVQIEVVRKEFEPPRPCGHKLLRLASASSATSHERGRPSTGSQIITGPAAVGVRPFDSPELPAADQRPAVGP